jgi:chemotaxis protein CheY-P-specific phosphatase CheC
VASFAEIIKHITNMLKKDVVIKWSLEEKSTFQRIKKDLVEAHVLVSLDYAKEFFIFSFSFEETIVVVLLQKNEEGHEQAISFFSKALRDVELSYEIL